MATKILAIDDSKTMRLAVKITFAAEDADVTSASKGSDALARAKQLSPDVVLVDAELAAGEPSGYDVCLQLKSDPATANIPVVLMVSNQKGVDQGRFGEVGGDAFVVKPFDTQDLIDKVNGAIGGAVAKPTAAATAAKPAPVAAKPAPAPSIAKPAPRPAAPAPRPATPKPAPRPVAKPAPSTRPISRPVAAAKPAAAKPPVRSAVGTPPVPRAAVRPATPTPAPAAASRAASPAATQGPIPIAVPIPFTAADSPTPGMLARLSNASGDAGLDPQVAQALVSLSREVIEAVVWEVVPDLAEEIIKNRAVS